MELAELLAREAIRDIVARYNSFGDSGLFDRVLDLFSADAVLEIAGVVHEGCEQIRAVFDAVPERTAKGGIPAYLRHFTSSHQIDVVDETTATGRCYFLVLTAVGLDHWGRYLDDYRVVDGRWRFARRRVLTDGFSPPSLFRTASGD